MIDEKKLIKDITDVEVAWYLDGNYTTYDSTTIMEIIKEQPKIDRWNPTSEGMPKENGEYLCQINFGNHELFEVLSFSTNLYEVDEYDFCDINRAGFYDFDSEWGYHEVHNVVAWQLLPESYKG